MSDYTLLGMPLCVSEDDEITTVQPISGVVVVKALAEDGEVVYLTAATSDLMSVECLGMADFLVLKLKHSLANHLDNGV